MEEEEFATCLDGKMTKSDDKEKNMIPKTPCPKDAMKNDEEEGTEPITPRTEIGSKVASNTPKEIVTTQYV